MISRRVIFLRKPAFRSLQPPRNISTFRRVSRIHFHTKAGSNHLGKLKPFIYKLKQQRTRFSCNRDIPLVYYDEIKDLCKHPEKLLIDVREPNEVRFGRIPESVNIPLANICQVLAINEDDDQFQEKYGRPKPDIHTYIIIYCRSGRRSIAAARSLAAMGYENVHSYSGSWLDYVKNGCGE